jgi:glutathione S-transferase
VQSLNARLASKPWLGGPAPGLTDVAIMPFVRQFAQTDRPWFDSQALAYVHVWLAEWLASSLFQAAMLRVPPWKPGEEPVLFGAG